MDMKRIYEGDKEYKGLDKVNKHLEDFRFKHPKLSKFLEFEIMSYKELIEIMPITDKYMGDGSINNWTYYVDVDVDEEDDFLYIWGILREGE